MNDQNQQQDQQQDQKVTDYETMRRIKEEVEAELLARPGVTGVDIGYKTVGGRKSEQLAIRVYVEEKKDLPESAAIPRELRGAPTDVIERRFVLHAGSAGSADTPIR